MAETPTKVKNPVIPGEFADPDIHRFGGKYYIYPTTDGHIWWSGWQFHCFSSADLAVWHDEGVILDVKNDAVTGEENENGIPGVPWAVGSAWAPTIGERGGKYYYYFCAKRQDGVSCIGVAVADCPTGPFCAEPEPLLTPEICEREAGIRGGQTIDPSVFEDDGRYYLLFGNGYGAVVELAEDMVSILPGTMHKYRGTHDLRESIIAVRRGGRYHFTWSCDDAGSENYHINYGVSDSLYGDIEYICTLLEKRPEEDILGTGHHSVLHIPETDEYIICYHRFATPKGKYHDGFGYHRETCIDRLTYNDETGLFDCVTPTNEHTLAEK